MDMCHLTLLRILAFALAPRSRRFLPTRQIGTCVTKVGKTQVSVKISQEWGVLNSNPLDQSKSQVHNKYISSCGEVKDKIEESQRLMGKVTRHTHWKNSKETPYLKVEGVDTARCDLQVSDACHGICATASSTHIQCLTIGLTEKCVSC